MEEFLSFKFVKYWTQYEFFYEQFSSFSLPIFLHFFCPPQIYCKPGTIVNRAGFDCSAEYLNTVGDKMTDNEHQYPQTWKEVAKAKVIFLADCLELQTNA